MKFLSLFTGIGLHDLGLEWAGMKCIGQCEMDDYCVGVLERHWPDLPRWRDVHNVNRDNVSACDGWPDLITGGFPCQQVSCAGKGDGIGTEANPTAVSGLWWEMRRIIDECRPRWVLIENVPALRVRGADGVLAALEMLGYTCWPLVVGACHAGATIRRRRAWILALAQGRGEGGNRAIQTGNVSPRHALVWDRSLLSQRPEAAGYARDASTAFVWPAPPRELQQSWELPCAQPCVGRPTDRRERVAELMALGNANPPQMTYLIGSAILEVERQLNAR